MPKHCFLGAACALAVLLAGCAPKTQPVLQSPESKPELTPSVSPATLERQVDFSSAQFITAQDGEITIQADTSAPALPRKQGSLSTEELPADTVWQDTTFFGTEAFTLPEEAVLENGSLGELSIPKIGLTVSVYETDDEMEDMTHGVAHFKETSCWNGNVGLAGHNQGVNSYFGEIHTLVPGDEILFTTALGTRTYAVAESIEIDETDWSRLGRTDDNRITLITCVNHDLTKRLCVQAVETSPQN